MVKRLVSLLGVAAALATPGFAHGPTAGDLPVTPRTVKLQHRSAAEIVALFAGPELPDADELRTRRAARAGMEGALLPEGVDGVLRNRAPADEVIVAGFHIEDVEECIRVLDQPVEKLPGDRRRIALTLSRASAQTLRLQVLAAAGSGSAKALGRHLVLEGTPKWLHRALRCVIRAELDLPRPGEASGRLPAP